VVELLENLLFVFQRFNWWSVVDILLVTMIFYGLFRFLRDTQAMVLLRGVLILIVLIALLTTTSNILPAFSWLVNTTLPTLLLAVPVIFAPEIRRGLERLGRAGDLLQNRGRAGARHRDVIASVTHAAARLSARRHGALIVIERLDHLDEYVETGVAMDSRITPELLLQIFYPNTPLHDGAVIISGNRMRSAGCVMPLSASGVLADNPERKMGLRHRAALGTSEVSDAVVVVVSEETGAISVSYGGRMIQRLDTERLTAVLRAFFKRPEEEEGFMGLVYRWLPFLRPPQEEATER
jgi:diadenylate cyclase